MKIFSIILMLFGYAAIVIQLYWAFILGWEMAAHLGEAAAYAIIFLLPGILLYRKATKKKGNKNNDTST
jgi:membrane protein implicated in regulation of membrane protease activity